LSIPRFINISYTISGYCILAFLAGSCDSRDKIADNDEGIIEFHTRAIDESHPLYGFAPDVATLKFKKHRFALDMSTMGMFNMSIIGNNKDTTMAQTIRFMNIRQACIQNQEELLKENMDFELILEETKETKDILGFKCYKIKVTKAKEPNIRFDAWYTRELGLENANALTPYAKIKGILLDYRIKKWGMEMHFIAKSYRNEKVPDNAFEIPASMKIVSKEEMEQFFLELQ
jgi:hypothetical protein